MSLFDAIFGQFIDVIGWTGDASDTLVWRFERHNNEIKHGAKLTVREGQAAVFVHEGQIADVFPPGLYKLKTSNLPILSTLQHWDHGFESPFKSEVYFVSTRRFTDLKWGTKNPIMLRDPEFGPTRLRAFGSYAMRVTEPGVFMREIVGVDDQFTTHEISAQLRNIIVSRFSNALATSRIAALDLAGNLDDLGEFVRSRIQPEMDAYGVEITKLLVENISLPPEVEKALDRRTSMGVVGDLKKYAQFQAAEALRAGAEAPGGLAGAGLGAGLGAAAGLAVAQGAAQLFQPNLGQPAPTPAPAPAAPPPPPAPPAQWHVAMGGAARGPFDAAQLSALIASGALSAETLMWRAGMEGWRNAGDIEALAPLFGARPPAPPPLPPSA
ncbi:MAG: SPFH domain-containing protein [Neomegalonema sp.]|nr:SPFH domain-containing protein [Neomegalonema sp.]